MSAVSEALERLAKLHPKEIDLSLDRIKSLLSELGNPHLTLPPVIHIAGTNGKGSTLAFIRSILSQAGYRVHSYTSPHLIRFNERIMLNNLPIDDEKLTAVLNQVETVNKKKPITFFEATTAAAFLAFSETPADFILLETGMGGRLDATNVVQQPALTLISSLSMDHEEFLGNSLDLIAAEKAAIFKKGTPALAAASPDDALNVLKNEALKKDISLKREGKDWTLKKKPDGFLFNEINYPQPALLGEHQYQNAGLAIAAIKTLNDIGLTRISDDFIAEGLKSAKWIGRLEKIPYPFPSEGWELWIDGGHNPGAGEVLAKFLPQWSDKPLHLICGMLASKDVDGFLTKLAPFASSFQTVPVPSGIRPTYPPEALALAGKAAGMPSPQSQTNIEEALLNLLKTGYPSGRILICGSLYLIGHFLSHIGGVYDTNKKTP